MVLVILGTFIFVLLFNPSDCMEEKKLYSLCFVRNLSPEGWWIVLNLLSLSVVLLPLCYSCELALHSNSLDWVLHQLHPVIKSLVPLFVVCWHLLGLTPSTSSSVPHLNKLIGNPGCSLLWSWQTMQVPICIWEPTLLSHPRQFSFSDQLGKPALLSPEKPRYVSKNLSIVWFQYQFWLGKREEVVFSQTKKQF